MSSMILHPWGFGNFFDASSVPFQNSTLCYLGMRFKYFFKGEDRKQIQNSKQQSPLMKVRMKWDQGASTVSEVI